MYQFWVCSFLTTKQICPNVIEQNSERVLLTFNAERPIIYVASETFKNENPQ
jgi:hypothetical protein